MIADLTSENAIVVIEFLTVVIEIFYLGPGQKGRPDFAFGRDRRKLTLLSLHLLLFPSVGSVHETFTKS